MQVRSCARGRGAGIRAQLPLQLRGGDGDGDEGGDAQYDNLPRESKVYVAKMAEQAERFEEMVSATKSIAKMGVDLTVEERSLLSVAYKNVVGARRASWKILSSIQHKETDEHNLNLIREYIVKVEKELSDVCREIISLLGKPCVAGVLSQSVLQAPVSSISLLAQLSTRALVVSSNPFATHYQHISNTLATHQQVVSFSPSSDESASQ